MDMPTIIILLFDVAFLVAGITCLVKLYLLNKKIAMLKVDVNRDKTPVINIGKLDGSCSSMLVAVAIKESLERVANHGGAT